MLGKQEVRSKVKIYERVTSLLGTGNTSAKVFIIVWSLTIIECRGHLDLMITKQYLLTTKLLMAEKRFTTQYSPR